MLSDSLFEAKEDLKRQLYEYTRGTFKNVYERDVILELQEIINRIDQLHGKLDTSDFKGSYRFNA